jgi:SOS-response transcriptional repressor LexA/plasmid maintenance system antidote protein VapI
MASMYDQIKFLCDEKEISISELCKEIGIGRSTMTELKSARTRSLSSETVAKIGYYFDVPIEYLLSLQPFEFWSQINTNRKAFIASCKIPDDRLTLIWGFDHNTVSFLAMHDFIKFIAMAIKYVAFAGNEEFYIEVKDEYADKKRIGVSNTNLLGAIPLGEMHPVPILGKIRAGYGLTAVENIVGYMPTEHGNYEDCFWLKVEGNSMEPRVFEGDFVLIDQEAMIENGDIVAVIIDGEDGTIKKYEKQENAIVLKPLNSICETRVFVGKDQEDIYIAGKVVEIKAVL